MLLLEVDQKITRLYNLFVLFSRPDMTISILESLRELKEDGLKTPGQSHFCSHTDMVCTASALVVLCSNFNMISRKP